MTGAHGGSLPRIAAGLLLLLGLSEPAMAQRPAQETPPELRDVGFEQRLGAPIPLDLRFRDESGREVELAHLIGGRPAILALVYYECPMLCTLVLNGLTSSLKALDLEPGRDFEVVAVSFDPDEGPALAARKKQAYLDRYGRPETAAGWHFLTGDPQAITRLTASVGFRYAYDAEADQFAHASGVVVLTADGRAARYLYGVEYAPRDLRLALVEASEGRIGSLADRVLLFCYHYDPATGRYSGAALNLVRLGGGLTVFALGWFVVAMRRRESARSIAEGP